RRGSSRHARGENDSWALFLLAFELEHRLGNRTGADVCNRGSAGPQSPPAGGFLRVSFAVRARESSVLGGEHQEDVGEALFGAACGSACQWGFKSTRSRAISKASARVLAIAMFS